MRGRRVRRNTSTMPQMSCPWLSCSATGSISVAVDGAGHAPVVELIRRVPAQEGARLVGEAHLGERRAGERPVADPRAPVAARPGLDARPFAVHEDPGERRAQARRERLGAARQLDRHASESRAPVRDGFRQARVRPRRGLQAVEPRGGFGCGGVQRHRDGRRSRDRLRRAPGRRRARLPRSRRGSSITLVRRHAPGEQLAQTFFRLRRTERVLGATPRIRSACRSPGPCLRRVRSRSRALRRRRCSSSARRDSPGTGGSRGRDALGARRRSCSRPRSGRPACSAPGAPAANAVTRSPRSAACHSTDGIGR